MRRISISELNASPGEIGRLAKLLAAGGIAAVPTETYYGLAADPRSEAGVARIFDAKRRDGDKPLPVLFAMRKQLDELGILAGRALLDRYLRIWPAPLTVVLTLAEPIAASRGARTLAVRMPAARELLVLLESTGALTGTSANCSGGPPLSDPEEVAKSFGESLDLLVDGGTTPGGKPSTLVDATVEPAALLRAGAFPWPDRREIEGPGSRV